MSSRIALHLAALALGAAFASAPALAQYYPDNGYRSEAAPGYGNRAAPGGAYREAPAYGTYNEAPGVGTYDEAPTASLRDQSADAECAARFRSFDPASGTFLGYDGRRHPCP